ncbi:MAG: glycosyltransferase family 39 protein [Candidatus Eisenbacteria bacterium]
MTPKPTAGRSRGAPIEAATDGFRARRVLLALLAAFLATRIFALVHLELHNDSALFVEMSREIAADRDANKYLSMDGRLFGVYKDPLQLWIGAIVVGLSRDPVLPLRITSMLFGLVNVLFLYLFASRLFENRRIGAIAAALAVFSDYLLLFDSLFLAEVYVYGLGAVFLYLVLLAIEGAWSGRPRWIPTALAAPLFGSILLVKQSGAAWGLFACMVLPLFLACRRLSPKGRAGRILLAIGTITAILVLGRLLYNQVIPAEFASLRRSGPLAEVHTFGPAELLRFPAARWLGNLRIYFAELLRIETGGLWIVPAAFLVARLARRKKGTGRGAAGALLLAWILSFLPFVLVMKHGFIRHFGIGIFFFHLAAADSAYHLFRPGPRRRTLGLALLGALVAFRLHTSYLPLARDGQTDLAMRETPEGWANGLGISAMLRNLEGLPRGVLLIDPQWGHPGMPVWIHEESYPQLELVSLTPDVLSNLDALRERARGSGRKVFFLLDARARGERPFVDSLLDRDSLWARKTVIPKVYRGKRLPDSTIVIAEARPFGR